MEKLIDACRTMTTDEILAMPDIQERIVLYNEQTEKFKEMVMAHTIVDGNLIISDLRGVDPIYTGNRFMIYSMYPEQNVSAWIVSGRGGQGCSAAVGYSILNRTATMEALCSSMVAVDTGRLVHVSSRMTRWIQDFLRCLRSSRLRLIHKKY